MGTTIVINQPDFYKGDYRLSLTSLVEKYAYDFLDEKYKMPSDRNVNKLYPTEFYGKTLDGTTLFTTIMLFNT